MLIAVKYTLLATLLFMSIGAVRAESIRDDVRTHVEESLEKVKAQQKKKREKTTPKKPDNAATPETEAAQKTKKPPRRSEDQNEETIDKDRLEYRIDMTQRSPDPALPKRVIHENFQLDLKVGVGYRGWTPQNYPAVSVEPAHYFTWGVGGTARVFKVVSLSKLRYESNNAAAPRRSYMASAAKYGRYALKAAWFLMELGVEALKQVQPVLRYESRAFLTRAKATGKVPVCVVPFKQDADVEGCTTDDHEMTITSSLESAALGLRFNTVGKSRVMVDSEQTLSPSIFVGAAYLSYLKPYQVTIGEYVLDKYLFTGRFYGGGLAFGLNAGGGVNTPYIDAWFQLGLGRVRLTRDMTLNELAPDDWLIGYVQGNVRISYQWAPFDFAPTLLFVPDIAVSGASFFFFETEVEKGEETAMPSINWDLLYTARLSLVLTL